MSLGSDMDSGSFAYIPKSETKLIGANEYPKTNEHTKFYSHGVVVGNGCDYHTSKRERRRNTRKHFCRDVCHAIHYRSKFLMGMPSMEG